MSSLKKEFPFSREDFIADNGKVLGRGLFYELSYMDLTHVLFTVKDTDHKGFTSFPNLYMSYTEDDPTEWTLANEVFTSWAIWENISKQKLLQPLVEELRKQNAIRLKSKAIKKIAATALDDTDKNSYMASKYLIEKDLINPTEASKRAPAKGSVRAKGKEAEDKQELSAALKLVEKDAALLNLKVVK